MSENCVEFDGITELENALLDAVPYDELWVMKRELEHEVECRQTRGSLEPHYCDVEIHGVGYASLFRLLESVTVEIRIRRRANRKVWKKQKKRRLVREAARAK